MQYYTLIIQHFGNNALKGFQTLYISGISRRDAMDYARSIAKQTKGSKIVSLKIQK